MRYAPSMLAAMAAALLAVEAAQARAPGKTLDESAWQQVQQSTWLADGAADPDSLVYVFADPYCPYCHALWRAARPYQKAGLQVRWVPVAYLHPDSLATAVAILEADQPAQALREHELSFEEGGIGPTLDPDPRLSQAVQANTRLMSTLGAIGTPAIVYRSAAGEVRLIAGMPRLAVLPTIFGLPEQPIEDPSLARFR